MSCSDVCMGRVEKYTHTIVPQTFSYKYQYPRYFSFLTIDSDGYRNNPSKRAMFSLHWHSRTSSANTSEPIRQGVILGGRGGGGDLGIPS